MSNKDYTNLRALALGNIGHEELAKLCLHQTATSTDLRSVLQAAHDRILHLNALLTQQPRTFVGDGERTVFHLDIGEGADQAAVAQVMASIGEVDLNTTAPAQFNEEQPEQEALPVEEEATTMTITILTQPELSREQILRAALQRGFKKRPQAGGADDLNQYVYDFAQDIRLLSRPDHHVVNIQDLQRFTVFEDNGSVVIRQLPDGKYVTFEAVQQMLDDGKIEVEIPDESAAS